VRGIESLLLYVSQVAFANYRRDEPRNFKTLLQAHPTPILGEPGVEEKDACTYIRADNTYAFLSTFRTFTVAIRCAIVSLSKKMAPSTYPEPISQQLWYTGRLGLEYPPIEFLAIDSFRPISDLRSLCVPSRILY
jgi:hypothetical protein